MPWLALMVVVGGHFESDEFSPNIPQLGRKIKGPRFNKHYHESNQMRDPHAKNPGVNAAISDPPPDMRLKPPMRGEVDKNDRGRNKQYDNYVPAWQKPKGDLLKGRNPNY